MKKEMPRWKKITLITVASVLAFILLLGLVVYIVWHDEISTIASIELLRDRNDKHYDGAVYQMEVSGDFYLDDFVEQGGVKSDKELINFISSHITKGLIDIEIDIPEIGCASFTAETKDGDALFGRNYDFTKSNVCIVLTEANEGRHASISTVDLKFLGIDVNQNLGLGDKILCLAAAYAPLDGMNDAGVSCGVYMTYQGGNRVAATDQNTDRPDLTTTTLLRMILDYADDLDEAVEIASSYDLHDSAGTSYHYMVADASGRSAILEWVAATNSADRDGAKRELKVIYNDDDNRVGTMESNADYQVVTNFIVYPGYYSYEGAKLGYDRYKRLYKELGETDGIVEDEEAAMQILGIVGRRKWNNDDRNSCTVHSVVYNMSEKTVLWVSNENYDDPTAVFTFHLDDDEFERDFSLPFVIKK